VNGIVPAPIAALPWRVIFVLFGLATFGTLVLYSAAGGSLSPWAGNHFLRFCVLMTMAVAMSRLPLDFWKKITFPLYLILLVMLVAVELIGFAGGGSQRWINLGVITFQPSELMKPTVVLVTAWFFDRLPPSKITGWDAIWPVAIMLVVPSILVIIQPDFDAALAYIFCAAVVGFLAGWPLIYFIGGGVAVAVLAPLVFFFGLRPYQQDRVLIFLNPEKTHWVPAITSPSPKSRSDQAACSAKALAMARRATSITCPKAIPTSSLRPWQRNGACSAASSSLAFMSCSCAGA